MGTDASCAKAPACSPLRVAATASMPVSRCCLPSRGLTEGCAKGSVCLAYASP